MAIKDYGVDGVYCNNINEYDVYQVKFRTNRHPLTWSELSTFIGISDSYSIRCRVLITNCDTFPEILKDRRGFFCIRGSDLDRLDEEDFRAIAAWLENSVYVKSRKKPLQHQVEAIHSICPALRQYDRVSAIMACGTGKTLVSLWVVEQMQVGKVLVLVPSLSLLRQVLHEWLRETIMSPLAYLCVCSDGTVSDGIDSISTSQTDLDFPVSTDRESVRGFLDREFDGVKIIFSTYQSAHIVGESLADGEMLDLAIFDEAHKTAGRKGRNLSFALNDENIPIQKRLFFTATPRHYNPHKKNNESENELVFSMDAVDVYGPQAYVLNFGEAARRGIICEYRIIISIITSEMITKDDLFCGCVDVCNEDISARVVANQIALKDAVLKYNVKKIFTFHSTVKAAASFASESGFGVKKNLPHFSAFHVSGKMPTALRERQMRDFRLAHQAVMSNARCLTEGVDVPSVDMVAFLSPRRSKVDIVQATGRTMRKSPGKACGYVFVPLYLEIESGESVEEAVSRSNFDEIWDVVNSLQEQDDVLCDIIRGYGESKGSGDIYDIGVLKDKIDIIGNYIEFDSIQKSVAVKCLDNLYSPWDCSYGKIKKFYEKYGHCDVGLQEDGASLQGWASRQRSLYKNGLLAQNKVLLLEKLGFIWDVQAIKGFDTWMKWYGKLKEYVDKFGDPHVPRTYEDSKLASWVWIQRIQRYKQYGHKNLLSDQQVELLDKLGFRWDAREEKWRETLLALKSFKSEFGHFNVEYVYGRCSLSNWVRAQRISYSNKLLSEERTNLLDEIGFTWENEFTLFDLKWDEMFEKLKQYYSVYNDADVPSSWQDDPMLARWVSTQRQKYKKNLLSEKQICQLNELNFTWKHRERDTWEDRYRELVSFKQKHGHWDVPVNYVEMPKLRTFVSNLRHQMKAGKLSKDRLSLLEKIDFQIDGEAADKWSRSFDQLLEFKKTYGHCDVPYNYHDRHLASWVAMQRHYKIKGLISGDREDKLNKIGFLWGSNLWKNKNDSAWDESYAELRNFKNIHGHCCVPVVYNGSKVLYRWVTRQRKNWDQLSPSRKEALKLIGITEN